MTARRGDLADRVSMVVYYVGCVALSGLVMVLTEPLPTSLGEWEEPLELTLGVGYIMLALLAALARVMRVRVAEVHAIWGLALLSGAHGLVLLMAGQWAAGVRLAGAPLMMVSYGYLMHRGGTVALSAELRQAVRGE